jgi:hypothetical protein
MAKPRTTYEPSIPNGDSVAFRRRIPLFVPYDPDAPVDPANINTTGRVYDDGIIRAYGPYAVKFVLVTERTLFAQSINTPIPVDPAWVPPLANGEGYEI